MSVAGGRPDVQWRCRAALAGDLDVDALGLAPAAGSSESDDDGMSETELELLISNNTGMQLSFLGTCAVEYGKIRSSNSVALRLGKSIWLLDCGEDTQRQLMRQPHIRHGKIDRIFITSLDGENILGLPGMLCSLSSARVKGQEIADMPLHLYGPPGLAEYIRAMLQVSDTYLEMPVLVHELMPHAVRERDAEPYCLNPRARLWALQLAPDELNPVGYYDGDLRAFLNRHKGRKRNMRDLRSSYRELMLPPPGDASRTDVAVEDMTWTIKCGNEYAMSIRRLPHVRPSFGLALQEADSSGRLDAASAASLGVEGRQFSALKEGRDVTTRDGRVVKAADVVGPDRPGRKIVVLGDTTDATPLASWGADADLVVAGVSTSGLEGRVTAERLACCAGRFAAAVDAENLVLTRCPPAVGDAAEDAKEALIRQAAKTAGKAWVLAAEDLLLISVQRREVANAPGLGDC
ncbi:hypothetical protein WJX72_008356 [[Myrmecia] bisecta]|uniref:Uncharacterized protein n=1 Tax=[Myrmecia] bisecta TaxID=41462 RepID=A0AAW1R8C2_9CHLO